MRALATAAASATSKAGGLAAGGAFYELEDDWPAATGCAWLDETLDMLLDERASNGDAAAAADDDDNRRVNHKP